MHDGRSCAHDARQPRRPCPKRQMFARVLSPRSKALPRDPKSRTRTTTRWMSHVCPPVGPQIRSCERMLQQVWVDAVPPKVRARGCRGVLRLGSCGGTACHNETWMHRVNLFYLFVGRHRMANLGRRVFHDSEAHSHCRGFSFKSLNRQTE